MWGNISTHNSEGLSHYHIIAQVPRVTEYRALHEIISFQHELHTCLYLTLSYYLHFQRE